MKKLFTLFILMILFSCQSEEHTNNDTPIINNTTPINTEIENDNSEQEESESEESEPDLPWHTKETDEEIPTKLIQDKYDGFIVGDKVRLRMEASVNSEQIAELSNRLYSKTLIRLQTQNLNSHFVIFSADSYGYLPKKCLI